MADTVRISRDHREFAGQGGRPEETGSQRTERRVRLADRLERFHAGRRKPQAVGWSGASGITWKRRIFEKVRVRRLPSDDVEMLVPEATYPVRFFLWTGTMHAISAYCLARAVDLALSRGQL